MRAIHRRAVGVALAGLALRCGRDVHDGACSAGRSVPCVARDGCHGTQVCKDDRTFSACLCNFAAAAEGVGRPGPPAPSSERARESDAGSRAMSRAPPDADRPKDAGSRGPAAPATPDTFVSLDASVGLSTAPDDGVAPDAATPGAPCEFVHQTPCDASERCVWSAGRAASSATCMTASGTQTAGQPCQVRDSSSFFPNDDCDRGLACGSEGLCRPLCEVSGDCSTGFGCAIHREEGDGLHGVCEPSCHPVTQERLSDGAAACGSPNPTRPSRGCYSLSGTSFDFFCLPSISSDDPPKTHGMAPASLNGRPFVNGCAPGYAPLLRKQDTLDAVCIAYCRPWPTDTIQPQLAAGLEPYEFRAGRSAQALVRVHAGAFGAKATLIMTEATTQTQT